MPDSEKERLAAEIERLWLDFQLGLSNKRKYPLQQFRAFWTAGRRYALAEAGLAAFLPALASVFGTAVLALPLAVFWPLGAPFEIPTSTGITSTA